MCLKVLLKGAGHAGDLLNCIYKKDFNQDDGYIVEKNIKLLMLLGDKHYYRKSAHYFKVIKKFCCFVKRSVI